MSQGIFLQKDGLYDPVNEHDSCGVGFVCHIKGEKTHDIVEQGLKILKRLTHRGAVGADPKAGDGAGILIQIPHDFFLEQTAFDLPDEGDYGVGTFFLPKMEDHRLAIEKIIESVIVGEGQRILGWRTVPVDNSDLGETVLPSEPSIRQVFVVKGSKCPDQDTLERKLFVIRKIIDNLILDQQVPGFEYYHATSFSTRVINYKGLLLAAQVGEYYLDLKNPSITSALALVHQRFSTNTFPTWSLAHPFRMIAHNGEINTFRGNKNWINARRNSMASEILGDDLGKVWPIIREGQSDSSGFDNALELLVVGGYELAHAMMMLIPEAWSGNELMDQQRKDFYEYHAALMEPWDGPAAIAFTDGRQIGATLDRNGLRPARYLVTNDDLVVMASEMGVLDIPDHKIIKKWRLQPGKMFLIDTEEGRIIDDEELKGRLCTEKPYGQWLAESQLYLESLPADVPPAAPDRHTLLRRQQVFGYTQEDIKFLLSPMFRTGLEAIGSMGADNPPAVLSSRSCHLSNYFKQNFAQVTNPPIDPIREEIVMSLLSLIGPSPNLLDLDSAGSLMRIEIEQPILTNEDVERIRRIEDSTSGQFRTKTLRMIFQASDGVQGMIDALTDLCMMAEQAVREDRYNMICLSDRRINASRVPIPALLATSAIHHHLINKGLRMETGLVIETGAALEVHHFATLAGYGAEAINPWLAFDTIRAQCQQEELDYKTAQTNYIKAVGKGLKKVMSKMGISTYQSYCGAQIFDAVGLSEDFIDKYFTGTATTIQGIGINEVAKEALRWHQHAYSGEEIYEQHLDVGGNYSYRVRGEDHIWTPDTVATMQHAVRTNNWEQWQDFSHQVNDQSQRLLTLRGLMDLIPAEAPVPLDEVEPASKIVKRFATGAMSFGSISYEAHSTLAKAMNRLGGKSNTGEGGEEPERFNPLEDGSMNPERSAIKQIASGRFGVTTEYLVNSDDIQIKMAQGAKPGEGGQLPGYKVNQQIARVRHSTPGVGLISPPPHHDIYSIEDLAQLIHDLKNVQPKARISVKLVSEVGVGTVAAGVSKAHADHVTIAGYDGGTGASPLTSIKHAGSPWEIGLAETHQTLVKNRLRSRISVQVDGGLRTGRDVVIAALLGADEFGFATAPLIAQGCIMMRKCHLNTCPVGVATQNPELRKLFKGKPEHVINYFFFVAEEVRQLMSELGYRDFNEMIGQTDRIEMRQVINHWKAKGIDYSDVLKKAEPVPGEAAYNNEQQDHGLEHALDHGLIKQAMPALQNGDKVRIDINVANYNRCFGTMLSGRVAENYGFAGLPEDTIIINAKGVGGQSFGAWLAHGVTIKLEGEANDYVGKGLSGGKIIIRPGPDAAIEKANENIIIGNTVLYGAIKGECYFRGVAGERFCVRNSGAIAVIEAAGDHCCEYMTGGVVVVLGETGRNFAAGMSGGIAYVYDEYGYFASKCNQEMVDLEKIQPEVETGLTDLNNMLMHDDIRLRKLIEQHARYTDSDIAKAILEDWERHRERFIKVMPHDYRRALEEIHKSESTKVA